MFLLTQSATEVKNGLCCFVAKYSRNIDEVCCYCVMIKFNER